MNCITILLTLLIISTSYYAANAREKHPFPPEFYAQQQRDGKAPPSILASHPDDIYWTDVSTKSGGLLDFVYQLKVYNGVLYALGLDVNQFAVIGRYTKKDGWSIICDIDVNGVISTFSVDDDNIYVGGNFTSVDVQKVSATNIVRFNRKTKTWFPMGNGLSNPSNPDDSKVIEYIEVYNGIVYIQGRFTVTGNTVLTRNTVKWDGTRYYEYDDFSYASSLPYNNLLINFGFNCNTTNNFRSYFETWDGKKVVSQTKESTFDIATVGVTYGDGFGIDTKNNYYYKSRYQRVSPVDSNVIEIGTCISGYIDNTWKLIGDTNWNLSSLQVENTVTEVDGDGQVFVAGILRDGIGTDNLLKSSYMQIVVWNGTSWSSLGSGVSRFPRISTIKYYDGEVYIGGFGMTTAGDKQTYGFAKWSKKMTSTVDEQPLTTIPEVHLSPNPAGDHITVELDNESNDCTITLFDLYGSNVGTYRLDGKRSTINTDFLSSGVYTLRVQYGGRIASTSMTIIR
ncbi:MAG: T9SS type A sorting domain-containing protein [Candidatus Kapaibacterium sp.]